MLKSLQNYSAFVKGKMLCHFEKNYLDFLRRSFYIVFVIFKEG